MYDSSARRINDLTAPLLAIYFALKRNKRSFFIFLGQPQHPKQWKTNHGWEEIDLVYNLTSINQPEPRDSYLIGLSTYLKRGKTLKTNLDHLIRLGKFRRNASFVTCRRVSKKVGFTEKLYALSSLIPATRSLSFRRAIGLTHKLESVGGSDEQHPHPPPYTVLLR